MTFKRKRSASADTVKPHQHNFFHHTAPVGSVHSAIAIVTLSYPTINQRPGIIRF